MVQGRIEAPNDSDANINDVAKLFISGDFHEGRGLFNSMAERLHPFTIMIATEDLLSSLSNGNEITPKAFHTVRRELGHIEPVIRALKRISKIYTSVGISLSEA